MSVSTKDNTITITFENGLGDPKDNCKQKLINRLQQYFNSTFSINRDETDLFLQHLLEETGPKGKRDYEHDDKSYVYIKFMTHIKKFQSSSKKFTDVIQLMKEIRESCKIHNTIVIPKRIKKNKDVDALYEKSTKKLNCDELFKNFIKNM